MDATEVVEQVIRFPLAFRSQNESFLQLARESGYLRNPGALTKSEIERALRNQPDLVQAWLIWSGDKRCGSGAFFLEEHGQFVVGRFGIARTLRYTDPVEACAEFIIRECWDLLTPWMKIQFLLWKKAQHLLRKQRRT